MPRECWKSRSTALGRKSEARAPTARPAVEVLGAPAIGERGQRGAHDEALSEGVEVGYSLAKRAKEPPNTARY